MRRNCNPTWAVIAGSGADALPFPFSSGASSANCDPAGSAAWTKMKPAMAWHRDPAGKSY
jgi:hypothetical protein